MIGTPKLRARTVPTGMRRVMWVRITVGDDGATCEVAGVGHRLPVVRRVSLDTALHLAEEGVPTIVRSVGHLSHRVAAARVTTPG